MKLFPPSLPYLLLGLTLIAPFAQPTLAIGQTASQNESPVKAKVSVTDFSVTPQQQALALLDQLLSQTKDFEGVYKPVKIILFQAQIADVLWNYDQPRARALFENAMKSAGPLLPKRPDDRPLSSLDTEIYSLVSGEILDFVLAHDAAFAERLASLALAPLQVNESKGAAPDMSFRSEQTALYCQMARRVAASDPQRAAELIRLSFNGFYSADQVRALNELRRHAPALADEIFLNAVAMVRNKPTSISNKAGILACYVFPDIKNEVGAAFRRAGDADIQVQVSPALIKSFLEFVYDSFTPQSLVVQTAENNAFGSASFDRYTMRELILRFERHLPDKADVFRTRVEEVLGSIRQAGRDDAFGRVSEAWDEMFRSNVQDCINKAEGAKNQKEQDHYYSEAAGLLAYRDEDFERALALLKKVSDSDSGKAYLLKTIRSMRAGKAVEDGDAQKAYAYSKDGLDAFNRAKCLISVARLFKNDGNAERAKAVLAEAGQVIGTVSNDSDKAYEMVERASVAVEIDPIFGFQIMKEAVEAINARDLHVESDGYSVGEDRKFKFSYRFYFDGNFAVLARTNFDRALELAKSIKPKEASLLAQFAVCKGELIAKVRR
jgi:hypothetical protein